jgi:DHA1 family multidrug resistance protein-like MFS transporter
MEFMANNSWRKNLYIMFVAELVVMTGFSFVTPFIPLYVQQIGNFSQNQAAFWSGISISCVGIGLFVSAPIWGILADRMGRKPMVLRSMLGGAVIIALEGLAPNIYIFIGLRIIQGLLTGTIAAASALVTSSSPRDKTGFALGLLMVAVYCGNTVGPSIGGFLAHIFGYRNTFFITAGMLLIGGLLVQFLVKENFQPSARKASFSGMWRLAATGTVLPLLITTCLIYMATQTAQPIVALYMAQLGSANTAAVSSGLAFALMGLIAAISSIVSGRLIGRISPRKILIVASLGAGIMYILPIFAANTTQLVIFVGLLGLLQGSVVTSTTSLIGISVPIIQQGMAYGLSQSANALGITLGPIIGGSAAQLMNLRYIFGLSAGIFLITGLLASKFVVYQTPREGITSEPTSNKVPVPKS